MPHQMQDGIHKEWRETTKKDHLKYIYSLNLNQKSLPIEVSQ